MDQEFLDALVVLGAGGADCSLLHDNKESTLQERAQAVDTLVEWAKGILNKRYAELIMRQVEADRRKAPAVVQGDIPAN